MASLGINYASSDEEETVPVAKSQLPHVSTATTEAPKPTAAPVVDKKPAVETGPINGPTLGPRASPPPPEAEATDNAAPGSPYSSTRALVQNLTLPTVPNFDIPPSPPGSPPQQSTKKFAQFLDLKKKGQHFNQRLEDSSVLRDPGHLSKLMGFAKLEGEEQYVSTLPEGIAVPTKFPDEAYFEELNASQKRITKAKEGKRHNKPREFVPASGSNSSSRATSSSAKGLSQSVADRAMVGSDRGQGSRSSSQNTGKRKELEHRGGRDDSSSRSSWRSRSRSPKRKRSRSGDRR